MSIEQIELIDSFIDLLDSQQDDTQLISSSTKLAESAFSKVWDNAEDAEYDNL